MHKLRAAPQLDRRSLLKCLGTAAAGVAVPPGGAFGMTSSGTGRYVERQSTGAEIWQVTSGEYEQSNIYCEVPYCSRDSRYFVYARRNSTLAVNRIEFMVAELGTWKQERLDTSSTRLGCAITAEGNFYYWKKDEPADEMVLLCADLNDGLAEEVFRTDQEFTMHSLGTVSFDERYYAVGAMTNPGWQEFDILLIDLHAGRMTVVDRSPYLINSHPQFDPGPNHRLLVHILWGNKFSSAGRQIRRTDENGSSRYLLSVPDGKRTYLEVGPPATPSTHHCAWIGATGEVLFGVFERKDLMVERDSLLAVRPGEPPRLVSRGYAFFHVGVSRCGRLFCCDDWKPPYRILIGSPRSGATAVVCESRTSPSYSMQSSHPHPYLTPDLQWVIYNSNRHGGPQIFAARVPEAVVDRLLAS